MENRTEHIAWCKERALEYVAIDDLKNAFASFQSDMSKHPETMYHLGLEIGTMLLVGGMLRNTQQMREWIEGFN